MPRLLEWTRKIQKSYHLPPIMDHDNSDSRFSVCITSGGAIGAMSVLFSQIIVPGDVILLDEYVFSGTRCCVSNIFLFSDYMFQSKNKSWPARVIISCSTFSHLVF